MDAEFWHARWRQNQIAFHEREGNARLAEHFEALALTEASRIFLPLCGKTRDIAWLLAHGHRVVGAELSGLAIAQLFDELGTAPQIAPDGELEHHAAPGLDIFVGDVFALTAEQLGPVDAVFDRAALVALPEAMRGRYAAHLAAITAGAPQLLVCFEYDQAMMAGPPFAVDGAEIARVHGRTYAPSLLSRTRIEGGLKGHEPVDETAWLLRPL